MAATNMYEDNSLVRQLHHGSRHVVHGAYLAAFEDITDPVPTSWTSVYSGPRLKEIATQGETNQTAGGLNV